MLPADSGLGGSPTQLQLSCLQLTALTLYPMTEPIPIHLSVQSD